MIKDKELWRDVAQCPAYQVSDRGRVRHKAKGTIKGAPIARNGYRVVNLWTANIGRVYTVHSLVAEAFIGPRPEGWSVNHIDGDKLNNLPENLEYMTLADNTRHQARTGLGVRGERSPFAKLTEAQAKEIKIRSNNGERTSALAKEFGVGSPIISQIKNGSRWKHLG